MSLNLPSGVQQAIDVQRTRLAGIVIPPGVSSQVRAMLKQAIDESFVSGFRVVLLICAGLALASALVSWLMIDGKK
jgi:hypothetical protein